MGVQNPYNNYIKGQMKKPINNFKEKVKNSLSGVSSNANVVNTPTQNAGANPVVTPPKPQPQNNVVKPNPTTVTPQTQPVANQPNIPKPNTVAPPQNAPTPTPNPEGGQEGLIPLSDMQKQMTTFSRQGIQAPPPVARAVAPQPQATAVNEVASNPSVQRQARSEGKTPQQLAQELLNQQQEQLKKDWELKQQELQMQTDQLNSQYQQSLKDAEKLYNQNIENIHDARYNQMEDLAVSGTNRGIQYSPQQLGLENVVNINHTKNITKATEERNNLLNQLKTQMTNSLAQVNMGMQNAVNNYNKSQAELFASYQKQMMDWTWDEKKTEEERKWQEHMANNDREWQKYMAEMQNKWQAEQQANQNKWQSGENALDREASKRGRSGGGGSNPWASSGGYSYTPWKDYKSYYGKDFSAWDYNYNNYLQDAIDYNNDIDTKAYVKSVKNASTDLYNAINVGGMNDLNEKAQIYAESIDPYLNGNFSGKYGIKAKQELKKTRDTALKHIYNTSYARSTNTPYQVGQTLIEPKTPVRNSYKKKVMENKYKDRDDYERRFGIDRNRTLMDSIKRNTEDLHKKTMYGNKASSSIVSKSKSKPKSKSSSNDKQKSSKYKKFSYSKYIEDTKKKQSSKKQSAKKTSSKKAPAKSKSNKYKKFSYTKYVKDTKKKAKKGFLSRLFGL